MSKFLFILLLLCFQVNAEDGLTIVSVGEAGVETESIYFGSIKDSKFNSADEKIISEFMGLLANDFKFYKKMFNVSDSKAGSKYQVDVEFEKKGVKYEVEVTLSKEGSKIEKLEGAFTSNSFDLRPFGHKIANQIYKQITGRESIFSSKIVFVTDKDGTRQDPVKELYIMDFDGRNKKRLTFHKGTVISPAISNDGKKILYSLIREGRSKNRNINLHVYDVDTGKSQLISSHQGINSGAIFMPDGENIALTLSHVGNAEIFIMNLKTKKLTRLTQNYAPDVDPSISFDGSLMTFLSGRAGQAMIYTMDPSGLEKSVKRISFVGQYNATPRFSPDGKEIVFSSWLDVRFDLFRIDSNGRNLSRLTKDFGSNEDPTYSADGEFIAFSSLRVLSQKRADQNIYIMDRDGEILGKITDDFGNCITPRWSKFL